MADHARLNRLRVLNDIAATDCDNLESVRHALTRQTYVDDICVGADTEHATLELQSQLIAVLGRAGLELKKWATNTPSVLEVVPIASRGSGPLPFDTIDGNGTKVLGIEWQPSNDHFCCALRVDLPPIFTKRGILSLIARIFDPLGLFGPATFLAKTVMQRTWQCSLGWDEPLPHDIHNEWSAFVDDLPSLLEIEVPRYINAFQNAPCYLLGFCNASQQGYAAVVYIRVIDTPNDNCVSLLGTKTKLAPLKELTVPRLELNAAALLARWLGRIIKRILEPQINIIDVCAWSDSTIVLSWLMVPHESFKPYVSNRIHQIHNLLPNCKWYHVESTNNPADCASRGIMPSELARLSLYWKGPALIRSDPSQWERMPNPIPLPELPDVRPVSCTAYVTEGTEWFNCFSSYDRMVRVVARMRRFIARCRHTIPDASATIYLRKSELDAAARALVVESQRVHLALLRQELSRNQRVSSKPLSKLSPFIDSDNIIRVGGRLMRHSLLKYECKHPILLAKRSHLALLLCERWHKVTCHSGPRVITALISAQYWIISIRAVLHNVLSQCSVCVRLNAKPVQPLMADLPAARVQQCRPFACVGVDYAGPLPMRELRLRKSRAFKINIAVFVCFSVKAVHLEVVTDLTTNAFLAAFDRFVARRGLPSDIYSDCGTNFVGADKQLQSLINSSAGQIAIANSRSTCEWHFNPPSAPHFGGLWEAAVRSTKRLLIRVIGVHIFTYEEFTTILTRVEAILNSRPLTPMSTDPHDLDCLTPGHFLIGQPLLAVPPRSATDSAMNLTNRWKLLDQCHQAFWRRWSSEYLTTLQEQSKWTQRVPNISVDDMVVIRDNQGSPLMWRLGRVTEVYPGVDDTVRVAQVLTHTGLVTRPVVKLVRLPPG